MLLKFPTQNDRTTEKFWIKTPCIICKFNICLSSHRGRWSHLQVHGFKDKAHLRGHLDDLSTHETKLLVVIQYSVHVLNPHCVHRPIENQPLSVRTLLGRQWTVRFTLKNLTLTFLFVLWLFHNKIGIIVHGVLLF